MYIFQPENKYQFETGIQREWIITNGLGGYASSTMIGANTRTYHGSVSYTHLTLPTTPYV